MEIRPTNRADIAAVDALLAGSYAKLLKPDYPASMLVMALPLLSRAQPGLVTSGTYYGVFDEDAQLVGAGGWSAPQRGHKLANIRHVITDHRKTRQGIGRALMNHILNEAKSAGARVMLCQSTLTAIPFYSAMGFEVLGPVSVPLRPGINFPAMQMQLVF